MNTTTEKQATGYEMTRQVYYRCGRFTVEVFQSGRRVFVADGCESRQHAE